MADLMTAEWERRMKSSELGFLRYEPPSDGLPFITDKQRNEVEAAVCRYLRAVGMQMPSSIEEVREAELDAAHIETDLSDMDEAKLCDEMAAFAKSVSGIAHNIFHTAFYEIAAITTNEAEISDEQYVDIIQEAYIDTLDSIHGFSGKSRSMH